MAPKVRRTRSRKGSIRVDRDEMAARISTFYTQDMMDRDEDLAARLQRYAKYRMWTEGDDGPWANSSDVGISDMMEKSLRLQDTLSNAVLAQRPAIVSQAVQRINQPKEGVVDNLLDYQFFEEAPGEKIVGDLADVFINDGVMTVFVPWVKDVKKQADVRVFPAGIPEDMFPPDFFRGIIQAMFKGEAAVKEKGDEPWDFDIEIPRQDQKPAKISISFYTRDDGRCEAVLKGDVTLYDAPLPRIIPYDDCGHPVRCENLQPPGPSNPRGAAHVWIRDYPGKDELVRLQRSGYYDLMTKEEVDALDGHARNASGQDDREEKQKDDLSGKVEPVGGSTQKDARSHETITRLTCFDRYDVDGDGLDEDVIIWYLVEPNIVVKMAILQEMYPTLRPDHPRPFAESTLFPIVGRRTGISMLEILEGLHDVIKILLDQCIDSNTIGITPFGFYRPSSSMQSETIRLRPGELYPLSDPSRDVNFPNLQNSNAQGMAINLMTMLQQFEERAAVIGDFQLGRVPAGRATALRTVGAINALSGQGEARPERILRRFFKGIAEIFEVMHDLNQHFLPKRKQIRINGVSKKNQDPYIDIADTSAIHGHFQFKFVANAFNTSKQQLQQTLQTLLGTFINQMTVQMGTVRPENVFNLQRDFAQALGVDPLQRGYLSEPFPGYGKASIMAEEAIADIIEMGEMPDGRPAEPGGWQEHLARILEIEQQLMDDKTDTGEITPEAGQMIQAYKATVGQRIKEEAQQQQMQANAQQFQQQMGGQGGGQPGRPTEQPPPDAQSNPQVSGGGELLDETLPGAKGAVA